MNESNHVKLFHIFTAVFKKQKGVTFIDDLSKVSASSNSTCGLTILSKKNKKSQKLRFGFMVRQKESVTCLTLQKLQKICQANKSKPPKMHFGCAQISPISSPSLLLEREITLQSKNSITLTYYFRHKTTFV